MKIITQSEKETFLIAQKFAQTLQGGEVVGLIGNLGAGKTIFAKGLAQGLGVKNIVNSPTFVIMKVYQTKKGLIKNFCHIDAYRLTNEKDLEAIGVLDYFNDSSSITLIEWPERVKKILPQKTIFIKIKRLGEEKREIKKVKLNNKE